jgi:hypothetical protein
MINQFNASHVGRKSKELTSSIYEQYKIYILHLPVGSSTFDLHSALSPAAEGISCKYYYAFHEILNVSPPFPTL